MTQPLWTIAILTVPSRHLEFNRIYGMLDYQASQLDHPSDVEIIAHTNPNLKIAAKRQDCLEDARGKYFNFVDDDDLVAHNYVQRLSELMDGVDYIGFRMQHFLNGHASKPTFHSLRYDRWYDDANGYYRNVSHLNPMRTEIARQGKFVGGYGEDARWAETVRPQTEHFVDQPLYFYFDSPENSLSRKA